MSARASGIAARIREANTLRRQGQLAEAHKAYRRVLTMAPDNGEALDNCGIVAFQLGRADEALKLLTAAVAARPQFAEGHHNLANVLQALGYSIEAATACRRAIALKPDLAAAYFTLGNALLELDQAGDAAAAYRRATELRPDMADAHFQLGLALHAAGDLSAAVAALEHAAAVQPTSGRALYSLGNVLQSADRIDDAVAAYQRALTIEPALADQVFGVGKPRHVHALLCRGDARGALDACESFLVAHPGDTCALAHQALVLAEIGEIERTASLCDFDRFIRPVHKRPPKAYRDIQVFNEALERHIRGHPSLIGAPASFSVEGGQTTGELLVKPLGPMAPFKTILRQAVADYIAALPDDPSHPFIARAPQRWRATVWAIIIGPGGHQVPHIHPSGWLSAVYYVRLPSSISPPGADDHGWIEFGRPYQDIPLTVEAPTRQFRPEEGLMLLFPSYLYHGTLPYPGEEDRISISFDVLPEA